MALVELKDPGDWALLSGNYSGVWHMLVYLSIASCIDWIWLFSFFRVSLREVEIEEILLDFSKERLVFILIRGTFRFDSPPYGSSEDFSGVCLVVYSRVILRRSWSRISMFIRSSLFSFKISEFDFLLESVSFSSSEIEMQLCSAL